jgi:hypothetical protein
MGRSLDSITGTPHARAKITQGDRQANQQTTTQHCAVDYASRPEFFPAAEGFLRSQQSGRLGGVKNFPAAIFSEGQAEK